MMKYEVECQLYIYWVLTTWLELGHMDCEVFFEGDVRDELLLMTLTRFLCCIIRTSVSRAVEEDRNIPAALYPGMGLHAWLKTEKQRASRGRRTSWGGKVKKVAAMDGGWQEQGAFSEERGSSSSYSQLRQQRLEVWTREPMFRLRRKFTCGTPPTKKCQDDPIIVP
uniref:Uncharacterized protein n=1 Tax=Oryza glumipatula TaxID=40148 RepID=A0A0D9ZQU4_9ORYZ